MEAAPAPQPSLINVAVSTGIYPESIESSPRSRHGENLDNEAPQPPQKIRLMCSYGGHIVPRPHDKNLCYVGGDTRIVVIDRRTSLPGLQSRLSKTLLNDQLFSLKYQIPNEDLDSLISVTTDEDLENMVEEYDRLYNVEGGLKQSRLRLFLFPKSSNIEQLLVETGSAKSDDWFFNALNGKTSILSRGASDRGCSETSSIHNLLGLDEDLMGKAANEGKYGETQLERPKLAGNGKGNNTVDHDVHSVPDSPMLEGRSSFGSTSSSPSMANLPPIKVRVEENLKVSGLAIEDQFRQMNIAGGEKSEELGVFVAPAAVAPQLQQKPVGVTDLPSPDSPSSDRNARNPLFGQSQAMYQQEPNAQVQSDNTNYTHNQAVQVQSQVQESGYVLPGYYDQNPPPLHQPQFIHAGSQYIPTGAMPVASYYHVYPSQQQYRPHQQQYPIYFMPPRGTQAYNLQGMPPSYSELMQSDMSSRPQMPQPSGGLAHHVAYNPANDAPSTRSDLATGLYKSVAGAAPPPQVMQHQAQFVGSSQIPQTINSATAASTAPFTYEFTDPSYAQIYYNQPPPPQLSGHYQTLAPSSAASAQNPGENMKQQQVRTLAP